MTNLLVTRVCNLKCPYCFAGEHMQEAKAAAVPPYISLDDFDKRLDFLERSGIEEARLIGGEPTLHPNFPELVRRARERNKQVVVFSNGLMPEVALSVLENLPKEVCQILINMNASSHLSGPDEREQAWRLKTLKRLGPRAMPGFTIYTTDFSLDYLLPIISETECRKAIRLGLAQAIYGGDNNYLHPKQYSIVGEKIAHFSEVAATAGVRIEFDCGFVPCMFSETNLETLRQARAAVAWRCSPILDIGLDGQALHCFPSGGKFHVSWGDGSDTTSLRNALSDRVKPFRVAGIYKECSTCRFKLEGECQGGCLAATLRRFQPAKISFVMPCYNKLTEGEEYDQR
ncbi:MAG: radical SAM protein [Chloroflexi bacterium]|uniref:Radical SAM protein n=1 Tax=Candidatus Chlorohelix allophototropha TaxID=3003348 RepID=A0A8T7M4S6_9CHLR|nr:radical SAM protein [Chloroflexota bacterium]WJW70334.1 radical SAM protein [Chloroflexota bacterium L227-S17]